MASLSLRHEQDYNLATLKRIGADGPLATGLVAASRAFSLLLSDLHSHRPDLPATLSPHCSHAHDLYHMPSLSPNAPRVRLSARNSSYPSSSGGIIDPDDRGHTHPVCHRAG